VQSEHQQSEHQRGKNIQLEQPAMMHAMMHELDKLGSGGENLGSGEKLAQGAMKPLLFDCEAALASETDRIAAARELEH
jgi:hypothetical protein